MKTLNTNPMAVVGTIGQGTTVGSVNLDNRSMVKRMKASAVKPINKVIKSNKL